MPAFVRVCAFSFQQLVGLQEAGLRPVLPRCFDGLPHGGSAPPLSRLLLGIHRHSSFCSPAGGQTGLLSTCLISAVDLWMHKRSTKMFLISVAAGVLCMFAPRLALPQLPHSQRLQRRLFTHLADDELLKVPYGNFTLSIFFKLIINSQ